MNHIVCLLCMLEACTTTCYMHDELMLSIWFTRGMIIHMLYAWCVCAKCTFGMSYSRGVHAVFMLLHVGCMLDHMLYAWCACAEYTSYMLRRAAQITCCMHGEFLHIVCFICWMHMYPQAVCMMGRCWMHVWRACRRHAECMLYAC
jgi:hypothetical protein